jgi:hypothetical protein
MEVPNIWVIGAIGAKWRRSQGKPLCFKGPPESLPGLNPLAGAFGVSLYPS